MKCSYDPVPVPGCVSMHHCPECGELVIAGIPHPDYDKELTEEEWKVISVEAQKCETCGAARGEPCNEEVHIKKQKEYDDWEGMRLGGVGKFD